MLEDDIKRWVAEMDGPGEVLGEREVFKWSFKWWFFMELCEPFSACQYPTRLWISRKNCGIINYNDAFDVHICSLVPVAPNLTSGSAVRDCESATSLQFETADGWDTCCLQRTRQWICKWRICHIYITSRRDLYDSIQADQETTAL